MIRRTIHEWGRINYGSDISEIPELLADRIVAAARTSSFAGRRKEGVLEHGRKSLRARGVVGVISVPGCQLEILPKIESDDAEGVTDTTLRNRLIHMLAIAHDLRIDLGDVAQLAKQSDTVLEVLIRMFCRKLTDAVRQGMPRQYVADADDLPAMRGSLDVTRQFSRLAVSPQKLACRFDALSQDIPLNQVMLAAIRKLSRISHASENLRMLRELSFIYADVTDVPTQALRWDLITLDRTNRRWSDLLSFVKLFLSDQNQQTRGGAQSGHALLFEMNMLFEKYVARLISSALTGTGLRVSTQGGHRDCVYDGDRGLFRTRPDVIIRDGKNVALIIDTKWKRLVPPDLDPKRGISQADVYQSMAYGHLYDCSNVMLLYPHHSQLSKAENFQDLSIKMAGAPEKVSIATFNLSAPKAEQRQEVKFHVVNSLL